MQICPHCHYRGTERECPRDGYPLVDETALGEKSDEPDFTGRVFDNRYEVRRLIGRGGMSWVFEARHRAIQQRVALKVMRRELVASLDAVKRFYQEARTCSQLEHPHTIRVTDFGASEEGYLYLAMEYLRGAPLGRVLRRDGAIDPLRAIRIARQVCQSLDEAHEKGMVHRDLKPDNIFLSQLHRINDWVKVLDFGIATFVSGSPQDGTARSGAIVGTPKYIAPEQAQAVQVDRRADLYALGVILFEMVVGHVPFDAPTPGALLLKHINDPVPAVPDVVNGRPIPEALRTLIGELLEKRAIDRPATATEVESRLAAMLPAGSNDEQALAAAPGGDASAPPADPTGNDGPPSPWPTSPSSASGRWTPAARSPSSPPLAPGAPLPATERRTMLLVAGLAVAVLLVGAALLAIFLIKGRGEPQPPPAATPPPAPAAAIATSPAAAVPALAADPVAPPAAPAAAPSASVPLPGDVAPAAPAAAAPADATEPPGPAPTPTDVASATPPPTALPPVSPEAAPVPPAPPVAAPPPAAEVTVRLASEPAGATVSEGEAVLGVTPLDLVLPEGRARTVTLRLDGHVDVTHSVTASDAPRIELRLKAAARPPRRPPNRPPTGGPKPPPVDLYTL